jgi:hypothetical protein
MLIPRSRYTFAFYLQTPKTRDDLSREFTTGTLQQHFNSRVHVFEFDEYDRSFGNIHGSLTIDNVSDRSLGFQHLGTALGETSNPHVVVQVHLWECRTEY